MSLSLDEEFSRAMCTWQLYDYIMYKVMVCEEAWMRGRVALVDQAKASLAETVLLFSDQIPFWVKVTPNRQLYGPKEMRKKSKKKKSAAEVLLQATGNALMSQSVDETAEFTQHRGSGVSEQDRYRITFESCCGVMNYFKEGTEPKGVVMRSCLVLVGAHGRLSNLDENGCFIKDEHFIWRGREYVRRAGSSARGLMQAWVQLRKEFPSLFENIEVFQQPSGFVDTIIFAWMTESMAEIVPMSIHQRDLFAGALSTEAKQAAWLAHELQTWVGGKMTPVLQLCDTDVSFVMKAASRRCKDELKRLMRDQAAATGKAANFKCGPRQVMLIAAAAHRAVVEANEKTNFVLAGLRRNGMLSYRPKLSEKKLIKADTEEWARALPEGSHRYPKKWLEHRYSWRSEDGVPQKPSWRGCGKSVENHEDMKDHTMHGELGQIVKLSCWKDTALAAGEEEAFIEIDCDGEDLDLKLQSSLHQEAKTEAKMKALSEIAGVGCAMKAGEKGEKKKKERHKRRLERAAMRKVMKSWMVNQKEMLKKYSRQQLMQALIPEAGKSKRSQKASKKAQGETKKKAKAFGKCRFERGAARQHD